MNHEPWNTDLGPRWTFDEHIFQIGLVQPPTSDWFMTGSLFNGLFMKWSPKTGYHPRKWTFLNPKSRRFRTWVSIFNWMIFRFQPFKKSGVFRRISSTGSFPQTGNWWTVVILVFFAPGFFSFFFASFWLPSCQHVHCISGFWILLSQKYTFFVSKYDIIWLIDIYI